MDTTTKWSHQAWQLAEPVYREITALPFVRELAAGTLPYEKFMFYIMQDSIYVANYCKVLLHTASRLPQACQSEAFADFAQDGIIVEKALHESYLGGIDTTGLRPSPACLLYTSFETAKGLGPVEVEAAAVLPCFWVYQKTGEAILANAAKDNPYYHWIETYGDKAFAESTHRAIEICDQLAHHTTPAIRNLMTEAFLTATRLEWMFWESAYKMEQWKI